MQPVYDTVDIGVGNQQHLLGYTCLECGYEVGACSECGGVDGHAEWCGMMSIE